MTSWRKSNNLSCSWPLAVHSWHVATKPLWRWGGWAHWIVYNDVALYVLCYLLCACWALCVSWTHFCFDQYIYAPSLVLVEHSVGSNTNNAWTPPLAVHSRHVTTKPLCWWGGWAHWIVSITSLYMYYALCFVHAEHSVRHEPISDI